MKFNISDIELKDLDGVPFEHNIAKNLGNILYTKISTLEWLEHAKTIHKGQEVELDLLELNQLLEVVKHPNCNLLNIEKDALITHIETLLKTK